MELGQRIKEARLAAGLSQKALCGDTITRNMLSLIESGRAKPSMDTLKILAERLGKTVSYFLEEDAVLSPNQALMKSAKAHFATGAFKDCLELLEEYQADGLFDDEKALLEDLALLALAEKALLEDRQIYARQLLYSMTFEGLYQVTERKDKQQFLLAKTGEDIHLGNNDPFLLLQAELAIKKGHFEKAGKYLDAMEEESPKWQLCKGHVLTALAQYEKALPHLKAAEAEFPRETLPLLEQCYRELEDYKMAYTYALKLRGQ